MSTQRGNMFTAGALAIVLTASAGGGEVLFLGLDEPCAV
jgi:hypothetical protein